MARMSCFKPEILILDERVNPATLALNGTTLDFEPAANVTNSLTITMDTNTITLRDSAETWTSLPAGWSVDMADAHKVSGPKGTIAEIRCEAMGPENDTVDGSGSSIALRFYGQDGNDTLIGGSANDHLNGGDG